MQETASMIVPSVGEIVMLRSALAEAKRQRDEALDALENIARGNCYTHKVEKDYNGQVAGTMVTDSGALSTEAEALELLAEHKRFRVVAASGRMVVGYWPENDPQNREASK